MPKKETNDAPLVLGAIVDVAISVVIIIVVILTQKKARENIIDNGTAC